jgi:hypothetical protein
MCSSGEVLVLPLGSLWVPFPHRYSAINVLCCGFTDLQNIIIIFLPHQDLHAKIATVHKV